MRRLVVGTVAAVTLATGAAACASLGMLGGFKQPEVTFKDVQIKGLGLDGGSLDVLLNVYNPNGYKLEGTRLTYRLFVDSTALGTGAVDERFAVQSKDSTTVRLPLTFSYAGLGAAGRQLIRSGAVNYRVLGDVTVNTPVGNFTRPFDRTGRFSSLSGAR